jgi:hypothetical protein
VCAALAGIAVLISAGCVKDTSDVLAKAYVAPARLNLRKELSQKNSSVAVLMHGQQVSVIDVRRRFVKVRSGEGAEGWVDAGELLSQADMDQIRRERRQELGLPSEGAATAYETLNIHLDPSRDSPAFAQISEGGAVQVLGYRVAPKANGPRKPTLMVERPVPQRKSKAGTRTRASRLPPRPVTPKPPDNWRQIWGDDQDPNEGAEAPAVAVKVAETKKQLAPKPVVMESWALVRTSDKQVGWVLARNLMMSIPDEVAQYAEGKRITSYFDLGAVQDEEKGVKHSWLWTTQSGVLPYDFDGWRVFLWNRRRHRYETSYRQRDVEGYFPVSVEAGEENSPRRSFALITKDDDGKLRQRTYLFDGVRVHLTGAEEYSTNAPRTPGVQPVSQLHDGWLRTAWHSMHRAF